MKINYLCCALPGGGGVRKNTMVLRTPLRRIKSSTATKNPPSGGGYLPFTPSFTVTPGFGTVACRSIQALSWPNVIEISAEMASWSYPMLRFANLSCSCIGSRRWSIEAYINWRVRRQKLHLHLFHGRTLRAKQRWRSGLGWNTC